MRSFSTTDTNRCWAPSWRLRSSLRRCSSPALTSRARDAMRSARACALATASETSSEKPPRRVSASGGSGSSLAIATAPHSAPATTIGAAAVDRYPVRKIVSAISPARPPQSSTRADVPMRSTCPTAEPASAGRLSPTRKTSMLSRLWRPTIVAVSSLS
jgi:hypothetical protein